MLDLSVRTFTLRQKQRFKVSYGAYDAQRCYIVSLKDTTASRSHTGYGEATVFATYGVTDGALTIAFDRARRCLAGTRFDTPPVLRDRYLPLVGEIPFACAALDAAAWDLYGKIAGRPVSTLLGHGLKGLPPSAYSIGLEDVETVARRAAQYAHWPIIKLKLGDGDDIARVETVRRVSDAAIRVDANGGWGRAETIEKAAQLKALGVETLEQPLPADDWAGMARIKPRCPLPIIADEACTTLETLERALDLFDGVTVKVMKVGGLTPALEMIRRIKKRGKIAGLGCMPESTIGISAIVQLAPLVDQIDIDSIELIDADLAHGVRLTAGRITPGDGPGLGFAVDFPDLAAGGAEGDLNAVS